MAKETKVETKKATAVTIQPVKKTSLAMKAAPKIPQKRSGGAIVSNKEEKVYKKALNNEKAEVIADFQASLDKNSRVKLKGTLVGASLLEVKKGEPPLVMAIVVYKGFKVKIPAHQFLLPIRDKNTGKFISYSRENFTVEDIKKTIKRRFGSEVDFRVTKITKDGTVLASRVQAMNELMEYWWLRSVANVTDENGNPLPYIRAGIAAKPRIVTVVDSGIYIELLGVESYIGNPELGHIYIDSAKDFYHVGDTIDVIITKVQKTENSVMFWASNRLASLTQFREDFDQVMKGDTYMGEVIHVNFDSTVNETSFFVKIGDRLQVRCTMGDNIARLPRKGSIVEMKITGKYEDTLMIKGIVTHVTRP